MQRLVQREVAINFKLKKMTEIDPVDFGNVNKRIWKLHGKLQRDADIERSTSNKHYKEEIKEVIR